MKRAFWPLYAAAICLGLLFVLGHARAGEGPSSTATPLAPQAPAAPAPPSSPDLTKAAERAAQAAAAVPAPSPSASPSLLYPPRRDVLVFSHARHDRLGVACARCHAAAATSRSAVDLLLPTEAACRDCHAIDRAAPSSATCGTCHRGFQPGVPVARVSSAPPAFKFSHAAHAATSCRACHFPSGAAAPSLPTMASCLACHAAASPSACTTCHLATPAGRIDLSLSAGPLGAPPAGTLADATAPRLRPTSNLFGDAHVPGFATSHASAPTVTCSACHDASYCADCHAGSIRPLEFHPADYLQAHSIEARRATSECSTCHRYQSFCVGCHERSGVAPRAASEWSGTFHPPDWSSRDRGAATNTHAVAARRALTTCASCHRDTDCLPCHGSTPGAALRISPHPRNWRGSLQCRALDRSNRRMCTRCHTTPAELGCDWAP